MFRATGATLFYFYHHPSLHWKASYRLKGIWPGVRGELKSDWLGLNQRRASFGELTVDGKLEWMFLLGLVFNMHDYLFFFWAF